MSAAVSARLIPVAAAALFAGGLVGVIDLVAGLGVVGLGHLPSGLVVLALHQLLALVLAVALHLVWPQLGPWLAAELRRWHRRRRGGPGETGAAIALLVGLLLGLGALVGATAGVLALGEAFATPRYNQLAKLVLPTLSLALASVLALRIAYALRGISRPQFLSRWRLLQVALVAVLVAYAFLWWRRDLLFKEIPPVLGLLVAGHGLAALWAQMAKPRLRPRALALHLLVMALVLLGLGSWTGVAPLLRRGAPGAGLLARVSDGLTDWDGDGASNHFGANDCDPFDPNVFPGAVDIPDDGIDQDCYRGDLIGEGQGVEVGRQLPPVERPAPPKRIVLISVDALRAARMGVYGYTANPTTPGIDAWARDAVVFDAAYTSGPYTIAAVPGMLSALGTSQIPNYASASGTYRLASEVETLPELLAKAGYRCAAVTSGIDPRENGLEQGFHSLSVVTKGKQDTAPQVVQRAKRWLDTIGDKRTFLWLHFFDPHDPYDPIPGIDFGSAPSQRYDASLAFMDKHMTPLLRQLEDPDTMVILVADHGEAFGEHGASNHGYNVYRENAQIPMIVRWGRAKSRRYPGASSILDVLPTVMHAVGANEAPGYGQSLLPPLLGSAPDLDRGVLTESYRKGQLFALSTADQRLIYSQDTGRYERYDLRSDPGELNDLYDAKDADSARLEAQLYDLLAKGVFLRRGRRVKRMLVDQLPPGTALPEPQRFGDGLELVGSHWHVTGRSPDKPEYHLSLYWRATKRLDRSWHIAVGLRSGRTMLNKDHIPGFGYVPGRGTFPTHQWPVGAIIEDRVVIGRMDRFGLKDWTLSVGVYDGDARMLPEPAGLEISESGSRVILRRFRKLKPLLWGALNRLGEGKP